jgi:hypothetical protein
MSGLFSGIGSAIGGLLGGAPSAQSAVNLAAISPGTSQLGNLAGIEENLAGEEIGTGNQILPTAMGQYTAGATGQLTPAQQALSATELSAANTGTAGTYSNLGLGTSTMKTQDLATNQLRNEAEQANLEAQSEQLGLAGLGTGLSFLNAGSSSILGSGQLTQNQINDILTALQGGQTTGSTNPFGIPGTTAGTGVGGVGAGTGVGDTGLTTEADSAVSGLDANLAGLSDADLAVLGI